jgi:hypothetical protein
MPNVQLSTQKKLFFRHASKSHFFYHIWPLDICKIIFSPFGTLKIRHLIQYISAIWYINFQPFGTLK